MTSFGEPDGEANLGRAWSVLTRPSLAWARIAGEPVNAGRLLLRYVAPLAVIPAICGFAGPLIFTFAIAGVRVRPEPVALGLEMLVRYVLTLVGVFLLALWIAVWAPAFGGIRDRGQALKLAAYSGTAVWISGVFALYPSLGFPAAILGGLYSLVLLYRGLPLLTRSPEERTLVYFAVVVAGLGVLTYLGNSLAARAAEFGGPLALV